MMVVCDLVFNYASIIQVNSVYAYMYLLDGHTSRAYMRPKALDHKVF